jgi:hypothetical protein
VGVNVRVVFVHFRSGVVDRKDEPNNTIGRQLNEFWTTFNDLPSIREQAAFASAPLNTPTNTGSVNGILIKPMLVWIQI